MTERRFLIPPSAPLDLFAAKRRFDTLLRESTPLAAVSSACTHCGATNGVTLESARTAYVKFCSADSCHACDGFPGRCGLGHDNHRECPCWPQTDPNAPVPLCRDCAKMHHEFWDAEWTELRSGQM